MFYIMSLFTNMGIIFVRISDPFSNKKSIKFHLNKGGTAFKLLNGAFIDFQVLKCRNIIES